MLLYRIVCIAMIGTSNMNSLQNTLTLSILRKILTAQQSSGTRQINQKKTLKKTDITTVFETEKSPFE